MFIENLKFATSSIWANKARSFLTMLGIIIGVGSVITLTSIGEGIRTEFSSQVESIGSNLVIAISGDIGLDDDSGQVNQDENVIYTQQGSGGGLSGMSSSMALTLTKEDVNSIRNEVENIETLAAMNIASAIPMYEGKRVIGPMVMALEPQGFEMFNGESFELVAGKYLTEDNNQKEIIIGGQTKDGIFGEEISPDEVIGEIINLYKEDFTIVGIYDEVETESSSSFLSTGSMFADSIVLPFSTNQELSGENNVFRIMINVNEPANVDQVKADTEAVLEINHGNADDFSVITEEELLGVFDSFFGILTTAVAGIAAISLVVGGIGIMNIMLVSVSERTKEIGVRKSIGATSVNVLGQFLIEAVLLSVLGGLIGVGISYLAGWLVETYANLPTLITWEALLLAVGVSAIVGIIFGISPAYKAARKSPIEALRHE